MPCIWEWSMVEWSTAAGAAAGEAGLGAGGLDGAVALRVDRLGAGAFAAGFAGALSVVRVFRKTGSSLDTNIDALRNIG